MPTTELCPPRWTGRRFKIGLLAVVFAAVFAVSLTASSRAQAAECTTAKDCFNEANWYNAVANDYYNQGLWFREMSRQNFGSAYEWNQKAIFAFHAGDATAAQWYKALADDYSQKSVANAKAADERFNQAAFTRAAAQNSQNRGRFFAALSDTGPSYPEGIQIAIAQPGGNYNCTGAAKIIKNQRKIEGVGGQDRFSYRAETPWKFCNGQVTQMYPGELWQTIHAQGWEVVSRKKVRAECYGPPGTRSNPERCAWSYQWHFLLDLPTVDIGPIHIDNDIHKYPCVTTQVKGNGAHYRHGGCDLKPWTGSSWGGGEY